MQLRASAVSDVSTLALKSQHVFKYSTKADGGMAMDKLVRGDVTPLARAVLLIAVMKLSIVQAW